MNTTARARAPRGPLRLTALLCAGLMSGAALLLAGCSGSSASSSNQAALGSAAPAAAPLPPAAGAARSGQPARLALASQSIIFTASLTIQAADVPAAASRATAIATAAGGYVSGEHASASPAGHAQARVSLQLKIPVAQYPATLSKLTAMPGTRQISLTQQAQDVTQQVADVGSLVTSAQAAITQLDALLKRTGTVADLLSVQEQINAQESSLEALQAQQRALARETSYATVLITLVGQQPRPVRHGGKQKQHGFVAGLAAGWRGLRLVVSAILTALGAALPFLALAAVLGGAGYAGRRRLRRMLRRGSRPTTAA
ncbi:MAG TPA: DUF4349 domain-containing protein [Streptosporangiaceae bacterium]|nr:DUF4349 domain-containing protein [Streptosporangiaceae bacterium]